MKVNKLKDEKDLLTIEIEGEDHTLANLIREECSAGSVSYRVEHPLVSNPEITVKDKNAKKALQDAAKSVGKLAKEFSTKFK